jgi:methionine-rich copper-binding protein CopC
MRAPRASRSARTRRVGVVVVVGVVVLAVVLAGPVPRAEAHALVVATVPADGALVDQPPDRVTIVLDAKPATPEGDPIEVYGPAGDRIDAGRAATNGDGSELSVDLPADGGLAAGHYEVVYRIVSADAHLVAGRFSFHSHAARPAVPGPQLHDAGAGPAEGPLRLVLAMAAGALVAVAVPGRDRRGRAQ